MKLKMNCIIPRLIFALFCLICFIKVTVCASILSDETRPELIPCKEDWFLFEDKCYKVGGKVIGLTWDQALLYCNQEGGTLAAVKSKKLQDFLVAFLLMDGQSNAWIGLKRHKLFWEDGSFLYFSNWESEESMSKYKPENSCVQMEFFSLKEKGKWNAHSCEMKQPFICQANKRKISKNLDPRFCPTEHGGGWKSSDSCYHFIKEERSWEEAEKYCQNLNGHLVTLLNERTELFLNYILPESTEIWTGIKIKDTDKYQTWSSGWRVNFERWNFNSENFYPGGCFTWSTENSLVISSCETSKSFLCETSEVTPPIEDSWECPKLSNDWINVNGEFCYMFENDKERNWFEANYECMRKGGALATIKSREEASIIYELAIVKDRKRRMYFGLHRSFSNNNVFEWIDGSELLYQHWHYHEPNNIKEQCGELFIGCMCWNDRPCADTSNFICSAKKVPPKVTSKKIENVVPTCPSVTEEQIISEDNSICKLPQNTSDIILSALEGLCSCHDYQSVRTTLESNLKKHFDPNYENARTTVESNLETIFNTNNNEILIEDAVKNEGELTTELIYTTSNFLQSERSDNTAEVELIIDESSFLEDSELLIDSSMLLPSTAQRNSKETFLSTLFKKTDFKPSEVSSEATNYLADATQLRKTAEEHSILMKKKLQEHELVLKYITEEHEIRGNILKTQQKLISQVSEMLEENPEKVNLVFVQ